MPCILQRYLIRFLNRKATINIYLCKMESVIITPRNKKELEFISSLLTKLGINSKKLNLEEKEDLGLALRMKEADRSKKVSEDIVMKKLKG